ncbi:MAG: hypothetical protein J6J17_03080 [Bacilli bacterium]|nr:hypothetical protein [Bacilli bacterium]
MKKVFLYLYPIEEFTKMFLFHNDSLYDEWGIERPLPILNNTINRRYREKGYQVVFALYPDRDLYGIQKKDEDRIIYTDISFDEASAYDAKGNQKKDFVPKYPNEKLLIEQLGYVDELVVGGYHVMDCVKRVAEFALQSGINTLVDIDLTDLFFNVYGHKDYFDMDSYSPEKFKMYMIHNFKDEDPEFAERLFNRNYSSPVYGFTTQLNKRK